MLTNNISMEVLAIGASTPLVSLVKEYVKAMRALWPDYPSNAQGFTYNNSPWKKITDTFVDAVRATVGCNIAIEVYGGGIAYNMAVMGISLVGHTGARWYDNPDQKVRISDGTRVNDFLDIDLKKVTIRGELVKQLNFRLRYTDTLMFNQKVFTDDELVAIMLHEFGHIFNTFMTLGDYAWLNYYLTDGIEILLGKKQNKFRIRLLSDEGVKALVPAEEYDNFVNDRNEESAKRVVFSMAKKAPRHHLTNNPLAAARRDEQLADLFASRLGYGRALAQANYKIDKLYHDPELMGTNWLIETAKALLLVATLPLTMIAVMLNDPVNTVAGRYDNPLLRLTKLRRDLVAQLKNPGPLDKDGIVADIAVIDSLLKEYAGNRTFFDGLVEFFRPTLRKQIQNTQIEDDLESLFNNDLFVQAFKLSKL